MKGDNRWLTLGPACLILGVNEATLRHWADTGSVRVFRTIGGHRRFSRDDIQALVQGRSEPASPVARDWNDMALRRIRRRLHRNQESLPWSGRFDEEGRLRMRLLGRRLLSLSREFLSQRRGRQERLEEARFLAEQQGRELAQQGLRLKEAIGAFLFFRRVMIEATREGLQNGSSSDRAWKAWQDVTTLVDEVLLALAGAYEKEKL